MSSDQTQQARTHYHVHGDGMVLHVISNDAAQAMLEASEIRIRAQEEQIRRSERVITCLIFRGILETLPDPHSRGSATDKWDSFLRAAIDKARADPQHPLRGLLERHRVNLTTGASADRITNPFGATLYRQLSAEIHHYLTSRSGSDRGDFSFNETSWLIDQAQFLKAMTPHAVTTDGNGVTEVDWDQERVRYLS